jgi:protein O-GlcNAc transferase
MTFPVHGSHDRLARLFNRGNQLASKGQYHKAIKCYDEVLSIAPTHYDSINNRGNCFARLGRHQQALACYDKVLEGRPNDIRARCNRGNALKQLGRIEEAIADYDQVLAAAPGYADALINRGWGQMDIGRPKEAIHDLRRALALLPNDTEVHTSLIFALNFDIDATAELLQAERARWAARFAGLASLEHANEPSPDRKLRIGYVSRYFRHQAATYSFGGVIVHHDPAQFEVVCYSDTPEDDSLTSKLRAKTARWRSTVGLSDQQLADLVRKDGVDILVDLVGHMQGHRLHVFARKPAPVQVTAWGEPTGTGLKAIDYLFADPVVVPKSERALLVEEVADLPNFIGFWSPDPLPDPNPLPALTRGYVTFGSFNRFSKVMEPVLHRWAAILRAVPNSRLVLKGDRPLAPEHQRTVILDALSKEGIACERVTFLDQLGRAAHFAAYHDIDIALDPFPHGGGMTTLDALWMGVPVVTAPGRTIYSRLATATQTALGLTEFIAADDEGYVQLAIAKANDLASLAQLRSTLRSRVAGTQFGDPVQYTRAVERHYRLMWQRWCENERARKA